MTRPATLCQPGTSRSRRGLIVVAACMPLLALSCRSSSPEQRVRQLLTDLETAFEDRQLAPFTEALSTGYEDERGDRAHALARLAAFFREHPRLYVFARIKTLRSTSPSTVEATVLAAVAMLPIGNLERLRELDADLHELVLTFDVSSVPRLTRLARQPASVDSLVD